MYIKMAQYLVMINCIIFLIEILLVFNLKRFINFIIEKFYK